MWPPLRCQAQPQSEDGAPPQHRPLKRAVPGPRARRVPMAPLPEPRFRFDAAAANGFVYAFGGTGGLGA